MVNKQDCYQVSENDQEEQKTFLNKKGSQEIRLEIYETAKSMLYKFHKDYLTGSNSELEIQAKAVTYIVVNQLGLDISEYSSKYGALGDLEKELTKIKADLEIISKTAKKVHAIIIKNELQQIETSKLKEGFTVEVPIKENNKHNSFSLTKKIQDIKKSKEEKNNSFDIVKSTIQKNDRII